MKTKLLLFVTITLTLAAAAAIGYYWYEKPRPGLLHLTPSYALSARELYEAFQQNEQNANTKFLEKVILVKGVVDNVQATDSTLSVLLSANSPMGGINCSMAKIQVKRPLLQKGQVVQIKGRCAGFLMDVDLVDALVER